MKLTKERCTDCTVVIISQSRQARTAVDHTQTGADKFIFKDKNALAKTCFFLDDYLGRKYLA